jgi:predicted nucleotidyltransferase
MENESAQLDLRWLRARREEILGYAVEHGARNVCVFGSIARGEPGAEIDVGLLVEMEPGAVWSTLSARGRTSKICSVSMSTCSVRAA